MLGLRHLIVLLLVLHHIQIKHLHSLQCNDCMCPLDGSMTTGQKPSAFVHKPVTSNLLLEKFLCMFLHFKPIIMIIIKTKMFCFEFESWELNVEVYRELNFHRIQFQGNWIQFHYVIFSFKFTGIHFQTNKLNFSVCYSNSVFSAIIQVEQFKFKYKWFKFSF